MTQIPTITEKAFESQVKHLKRQPGLRRYSAIVLAFITEKVGKLKICSSVGTTTGQRYDMVKRILPLCNFVVAQLANAFISCDNLLEGFNSDMASIKQKAASFRFQINFVPIFIAPVRRIKSKLSSSLFKVLKTSLSTSPQQIIFASFVGLPIEKTHSLSVLSLIPVKVLPAFFRVFVWHRSIIL